MRNKKVEILSEPIRNDLANDIQKRIDELSFEEITNQSNKMKTEELSRIKKTLTDYLIRYARVEQSIARDLRTDLDSISDKNLRLYIAHKDLLRTNADIGGVLQDGYILIENLRKTFTGKEIKYRVGIEFGNKNVRLIEKEISLAELLSYAKPEVQWRNSGISAFKMRASVKRSNFKDEYEKQKNLINQEEYAQSLYPKVRSAIMNNYTKINKGNIYETYLSLKEESGYADHPPNKKNPATLKNNEIIDRYEKVKSGTQSFVTGGDIGDIQAKLLSTSPSIAQLNTIGRALKLMLKYIEENEGADVKIEKIKENIFSMKFDELGRKEIDNMLKEIDNKLSLLV